MILLPTQRPIFLLILFCIILAVGFPPTWSGAAAGKAADDLQEQAKQLQRSGNYKEALYLALQSLQIRYQEQGPEHADTAAALTTAGLLYLELGAWAEALPLLQRALQIRFKALGVSHAETAASLNHLAEVYRQQGALDDAYPLLQRSRQIREKALGPEHPDTAASLTALALYHRDKGEDNAALSLLERALAIRERALGRNHPDLASSLTLLGEEHRRRGAYQKALPLLEKAVQMHDRTLGRLHPATAQSLSSLGKLFRDMGFYQKGQAALEQALQIRQKSLGLEHPLAVQSLSDLGLLYARQKEFDKAKPLLERALNIRERRWPPDHPEIAASLNDLAILQQAMGNYDGAVALAQRSLQIREKGRGPGHPETLASLDTLASLYRAMGAPAKAIPLYDRIVQAREKVLGIDNLDLITYLMILAQTYREAGQLGQTLELWQRAWKIREKALGEEHPETLASLESLAALALEGGIYTKALTWYEKILKIQEKKPGPESPQVALSLRQVARVHQAMGEYDLALSFYERAGKIQEKTLGPDHSELAQSYLELGSLYQAREEYDQALTFLQKAVQIREKSFGVEHPETALALARLATLFENMGWLANAVELYQKSVKLLSKAQETSSRELGQILLRLAALLERLGDSDQAISIWHRAARISEQTQGAGHPETERILATLGFAYWNAGEPRKAQSFFDRLTGREVQIEVALAFGRYADAWQLLEEAPPPLVTSPAFQVRWLVQRGRALAGVGLVPEAAVALWEAVQGAAKQSLRRDRQQLGLPSWWQSRAPQERLLQVLYRLDAQGASLPPELQELGATPRAAVFALAAYAKGLRFLEAFSDAPLDSGRSELPPEMRARLLSLQRRFNANEVQWERAIKGGKEALQEAVAVREKLIKELEAIQTELAFSQPLASTLYYPKPLAVADVPLAEDEVLIEYVLGAEAGFIMVVRASGIIYLYPLPWDRTTLADKVRELLNPCLEGKSASFSLATGQELFEVLLAKPLATVEPTERVIIVPDGILGLLPFEALIVTAGADVQRSVFVGDRHSLTYYPSTAVLTQQRGRPEEPKAKPFLGVGNPGFVSFKEGFPAKSTPKSDLTTAPPWEWTTAGFRALAASRDWGPISPGNRREQWLLYPYRPESELSLQELAALLKKEAEPAELLVGPQATTANLRRAPLADYRWLHVASYTDFSDAIQGLLQPFILLAREEAKPAACGPLTLSETLALQLGAHLVVLDTGIIGRDQTLADAGVPHLTRALMYAGARSVLVNLWPLPLTVTREFYQQLYTFLQDGHRPGRAVLQARQEIRRRHPDPKIWAAYQFWGEE